MLLGAKMTLTDKVLMNILRGNSTATGINSALRRKNIPSYHPGYL